MVSLKNEKNHDYNVSFEFLHYKLSDMKTKNNDYLIEYPSAGAVFLIEILTEEIEVLVAEKSKLKWPWKTLWIASLQCLVCQESVAQMQSNNLLSKLFSAMGKFLMETSVRENIPVQTKKYEFDYQDKLALSKVLWRSWLCG